MLNEEEKKELKELEEDIKVMKKEENTKDNENLIEMLELEFNKLKEKIHKENEN
jgi:hypothetical protein